MAIIENDLEEICIDWLKDNSYEYIHSDEISYDGANPVSYTHLDVYKRQIQ